MAGCPRRLPDGGGGCPHGSIRWGMVAPMTSTRAKTTSRSNRGSFAGVERDRAEEHRLRLQRRDPSRPFSGHVALDGQALADFNDLIAENTSDIAEYHKRTTVAAAFRPLPEGAVVTGMRWESRDGGQWLMLETEGQEADTLYSTRWPVAWLPHDATSGDCAWEAAAFLAVLG